MSCNFHYAQIKTKKKVFTFLNVFGFRSFFQKLFKNLFSELHVLKTELLFLFALPLSSGISEANIVMLYLVMVWKNFDEYFVSLEDIASVSLASFISRLSRILIYNNKFFESVLPYFCYYLFLIFCEYLHRYRYRYI